MVDSQQIGLFDVPVNGNDYKEICLSLSNYPDLLPDEFGKTLQEWSRSTNFNKPKVLALFSGAGGLDIGFCDTGFELVESVEIESKFVQTMSFNKENGNYFPRANILCEDIRNYIPSRGLRGVIDFVIGGPPCQSFSAAGRRAAGVAGTKDDRGSLFEEYVRVLETIRPKGFLFENVYGLIGAEKGDAIKKIVTAFKKIGYKITYRVIDAADYGVPQHRERVLIVGSRDKLFQFPKPTHGPDSYGGKEHLSATRAIHTLKNKAEEKLPSINGRYGHLLNEVPPGLNYSFFTEKMGHPNPIFAWRSKFSDFLYKADPTKPIRTLKANGGQYTGPFHWENRHFSIGELKRLQTFPDDYTILGNRAIISRQIGNSVPPQLARIFALSVLEQFFEVQLPFKLKYLSENDKLTFRHHKSKKTKEYLSKAVSAITEIEPQKKLNIRSKVHYVDLTSDFRLINGDKEVKFTPTKKEWNFQLTVDGNEPAYQIKLQRSDNAPLFTNVSEVVMTAGNNIPKNLTILWKIFENTLAEYKIKADLVQLHGYYQYINNIVYTLIPLSGSLTPILTFITRIMFSKVLGKILSIHELSEIFEIEILQLESFFVELRGLGFEIRNHNTNPEIPKEHYLIPYPFPTLTHQSVQLKKALYEGERRISIT